MQFKCWLTSSRFWVGGTGTWDSSTTTHWSATTGGAGGASVPGSSDTVTFDANSGGGTVTPNYNMTVISITMGTFTGTLDFSVNNNSPTMATFNNGNTGVRTLNMGNGTWTITGNAATVWSFNSTNLTFNAGQSTINFTYSGSTGTRTFISGGAINYYNMNVSAGSDIFMANSSLSVTNNFSTNGFTGNYSKGSANITIGGNITLGSGSTFTTTGGALTLTSTSTCAINTNSVNVNMNLIINGVNGTFTLGGSIDITGAVAAILTVTNGSFIANNFNINTFSFSSNNSNTRTINMGSGTWTLTGTGTIWNIPTLNGLTLIPGTSTISMTNSSSSSKTFSSGALTYNNLTIDGTGTGIFIIGTTANTLTFNTITATQAAAHTVQFFAGITVIATTLTWSGINGQLNTFQSITNSSQWNISVASGIVSENFISLQDSNAIGGAEFIAGVDSTNAGNNNGWIFGSVPILTAQSAKFDQNRVRTVIAQQNNSVATLVLLYANPSNHGMAYNDGTDGNDYGTINAKRDVNRTIGIMAISNSDGITPVPLYIDSTNNGLLVKST